MSEAKAADRVLYESLHILASISDCSSAVSAFEFEFGVKTPKKLDVAEGAFCSLCFHMHLWCADRPVRIASFVIGKAAHTITLRAVSRVRSRCWSCSHLRAGQHLLSRVDSHVPQRRRQRGIATNLRFRSLCVCSRFPTLILKRFAQK